MVTEIKNQSLFKKHPVIGVIIIIFAVFLMIVGIRNIYFAVNGSDTTGDVVNEQLTTSEANNQEITNPIIPSKSEGWHDVTFFSGKGNKNTESFSINGEKVRITATTCCGFANEYGNVGTYSAINLESEEGSYIGAGLSIMTDGIEEGYGQTTYRNLDVGEYYISIITGVNWEVKVEEYY